MTTSSVPETYSITFDDDLLTSAITSGDTITLSSTYSSTTPSYTIGTGLGTISTITLTGGANCYNTGSVCITTGIDSMTNIWGGAEFVNSFPAWDRIEKMCAEYPGLKIAFEKFKTTYYLVKDDYDTPKDKK